MKEKLTQIDLNLFVVFDRIYSERNLTRAAERLSLSQPAVSNALARLRKTLDDPLFEKTQGGMRPTAFAESIRDNVSEALRLLTMSAQAVSRFDAKTSKRVFRMSVIDLLDASVLSLLGDVAQADTHLSFRSFRLGRKDIVPALASGDIDLAVDIALPANSNLIRTPYSSSVYVCAMRRGHPLAQRDLTIDDYLAFAHIHVSGRRDGGGVVDVMLRQQGRKRRTIASLQSHLPASQLVRASDCLITVPREWAEGEDLVWKPLPVNVPPLDTFIYRHRRSDGDEAVLWLHGMIQANRPFNDASRARHQ